MPWASFEACIGVVAHANRIEETGCTLSSMV
jgi:hypothetical protein